jgi:CheY-like chemotaxis protein
MDISMPILDGFKSSILIRQLYRKHDVPEPIIVACTGHTEEEYILKAWRHEIDEVLPKPIKSEGLKIIISESIIMELNNYY